MHFPFSIAAVVAVAGFAVAAPTEFQPMLIGRPMQCLVCSLVLSSPSGLHTQMDGLDWNIPSPFLDVNDGKRTELLLTLLANLLYSLKELFARPLAAV